MPSAGSNAGSASSPQLDEFSLESLKPDDGPTDLEVDRL